jgi:hypothetical protein
LIGLREWLVAKRKDAPWPKTTLVQCARAVRPKHSYSHVQFYHVRARCGPKKTIMAAASILTAVYHMLKDGKMYSDLGPNHFQHRKTSSRQTPGNLGYAVALAPLPG